MSDGWTLLTSAQSNATRRVLGEESQRRAHLVASLSGAHAYGFPSRDSDVDVKAIHVARTERLVGLHAEASSASRLEWVDGVEIDYSSNEIGPVLGGVLKGNGNYAERILGAAPLAASPWLETLRPIVQRALNRRVHRHYEGFARSQLEAFDEKPTVKRLLYVLRTTLTGTHLLRTATMAVDATLLLDEYGFGEARSLVDSKRTGENVLIDEKRRDDWRRLIARAFDVLDAANQHAVLPEESPNADEIDAWLIDLRREQFGSATDLR